jgi:repressor LexA
MPKLASQFSPDRGVTEFFNVVSLWPMSGKPLKDSGSKYPNRLREIRLRRGMTLQQIADLCNTAFQEISKLERGERRLTADWMDRLARALRVDRDELLQARRKVPVVGDVGAGQFIALDAYAQGAGSEDVDCPRGLDAGKTVAVRVRGDSMAPLINDGWLLFYSRDPEPDAAAVIGHTCVVRVARGAGLDGNTMVRQVRRGHTQGKFILLSQAGMIAEDVELEWAAPVLAMLPPDLARADAA